MRGKAYKGEGITGMSIWRLRGREGIKREHSIKGYERGRGRKDEKWEARE